MFHGYGLPEGNGTIDDGPQGTSWAYEWNMGIQRFNQHKKGSQWEYNGNMMDMSM